MKKVNAKKILIVISIVIIALGIISGLSLSYELMNNINGEKIYVDGSNFSGLTQIGGFFSAVVLGGGIVLCSVFIDLLIWLIYEISLGTVKMVKKIKNK